MEHNTQIFPVILSGGSGTRLWPLSRASFPKQFLRLISEHTMIQDTILRLSGLPISNPIVVCNEQHRFVVAEQLSQIGFKKPTIILEPLAKNTAPAITAAALQAKKISEDAILVILPADHDIQNVQSFKNALEKAVEEAKNGSLVTFGVKPTFAATGYGYIQTDGKHGVSSIQQFVEKPNEENAQKYLERFEKNGDFFWNSGMFVFRATAFLAELNSLCPEIFSSVEEATERAITDLDFVRLDRDSFSKSPSISIDYAVMEKTKIGKVVPLDASWSDVGSWGGVWSVGKKDERGNVVRGNSILNDVSDSLIFSRNDANRTVTAVGLKNIVIVDTKDALLVAEKSKAEDVKSIVDSLKRDGKTCASENTVGYRPWGQYETIELGNRYRVKHITVKPGQKLSTQMHYHRAEHWIIVSGTAKVKNGEREFILSENQSTFIPLGTIHSIENPGKLPLEFIEVQSGAYLEEDDIIRFEDKYGRS